MKTDQPNKQFVFIGGGSTGPILLIYIAKFAKEKHVNFTGYTFHLIDPEGYGNGGIAYGKSAPSHILNTLPSEMSPWDINAYNNYLLSIGREDNPLSFSKRNDFNSFLQQEFAKYKQVLKALGVTFKEHNVEAYIQIEDNNKYTIIDKNGVKIDDNLINITPENIFITTGYGRNNTYLDFEQKDSENFILSLYPSDKLLNIKKTSRHPVRIAVLGSASALYDFILVCPLLPKDTLIYVFSSVGKEAVETREVESEHQFKEVQLEALLSLNSHSSVQTVEDAIKNTFIVAEKDHVGSRSYVAFKIMCKIGSILSQLDSTVAMQFRQSMSFKNLKRLGGPTSAFSNQKLAEYNPIFIPYDIATENINYQANKTFKITVNNEIYEIDVIVNATGHGRHNSNILEDMKKKKLVTIDEKLGLLSTDNTGYKLIPSHIACIGPATHFGVDGVGSFANYTHNLAQEIVERIK